jgi:hypothetical protein
MVGIVRFPFFTKEATSLSFPVLWLLAKFAFRLIARGKPNIPSPACVDPIASIVAVTSTNKELLQLIIGIAFLLELLFSY